jgi:pilus assembly protein CpaB
MVRPAMNPRQRRAVLLLALSVVGLIAVFALVAGYVSDVRSEVDPKVSVLALTRDAPANEAITDDMVQTKEIPARYAPRTALRDRGQIIGLVPGTRLTRGSILQEGMLTSSPSLQQGQRELAILVDAETGVAGKLTPGAIVDIIGTFGGDANRNVPADSEVVVPAARVIAVGESHVKGGGATSDQAQQPQEVVPVTFALTPRESLNVTYAESFANEVRLSLRRPGDRSPLSGDEKVFKRPGNAAQGTAN